MRMIKLVFEGAEAANGDIVFPDDSRLPASLRAQAASETVLSDTPEVGDYVANDAYTVIAMVTDGGYVVMMDNSGTHPVGSIVGDAEIGSPTKVNPTAALARINAASGRGQARND